MESANAPSTDRRAPRSRFVSGALLGSASLAVALFLYQELFVRPAATGYGDYQFFHFNWEFARVALSRHGELPLWDPYCCGGLPDFVDPQSQVFHPLFFLSFLLGSTLALKTFIVAHAAAGIAGMYLFARREGACSAPAAALAALGWAGSGFFAYHVGTGHGGFVSFFLLPWILLAWRRACERPIHALSVALLLTACLLAGGAYVFPFALLLLGFDALRALLARRSVRGLVVAGALGALLTFALGAIRLVPVLEGQLASPRDNFALDRLRPAELPRMLLEWKPGAVGEQVAGHPYGWTEYSGYVGYGVALLALAGVVTLLVRRRLRSWVIGALLFGSLMMGSWFPLAPWNLLKRLPLYSSLQAPSRFLVLFLFFVCLLAAVGLDELARRARSLPSGPDAKRLLQLLSPALVAASALPVALHHRAVLVGRWKNAALELAPIQSRRFVEQLRRPQGTPDRLPDISLPAQNRATGRCYTGLLYQPARGLWAGPAPQARVSFPGRLHDSGQTTRRIWADVELFRPGWVVFNQTWAPGWVGSPGALLLDSGRLALELPAGRQRVELEYRPRSLPWAVVATLAGLGAALALAWARLYAWLAATKARWCTAGLLFATLLALSYVQGTSQARARPPEVPGDDKYVDSSGYAEAERGKRHAPGKAIDDDPNSEWLATPGKPGWLEVRFRTSRVVERLVLHNATNLPRGDYGTERFRVQAFDGEELLHEATGSFSVPGRQQVVSLGARPASRIRITVTSWFGAGGGLAEIEGL